MINRTIKAPDVPRDELAQLPHVMVSPVPHPRRVIIFPPSVPSAPRKGV